MTDSLGPMVYAENEGEVFLGRSITKTTQVSEATMQKVDAEIRRIIDEQYAVARKILEDNRDKVEAMTKALLEWETIDSDQINDIIDGRPRGRPRRPIRRTPRRIRRPAPAAWRRTRLRRRRDTPYALTRAPPGGRCEWTGGAGSTASWGTTRLMGGGVLAALCLCRERKSTHAVFRTPIL